MFTITLPKAIEKRLESLARRTGHTKSFYVRKAIELYLEDQKDIQSAEAAL